MPVALYAAETTAWTNALLMKMKVFENHLINEMDVREETYRPD